ncbi:MAG: hypothetical protein ACO3VF_08980 [Tamlana sp.]|jgi:hypothetical protein
MNDKVQNVSIAALNALEHLGKNDELTKTIVKNVLIGLSKLMIVKQSMKPINTKNIKYSVGNVPVKNHSTVLKSNLKNP